LTKIKKGQKTSYIKDGNNDYDKALEKMSELMADDRKQ